MKLAADLGVTLPGFALGDATPRPLPRARCRGPATRSPESSRTLTVAPTEGCSPSTNGTASRSPPVHRRRLTSPRAVLHVNPSERPARARPRHRPGEPGDVDRSGRGPDAPCPGAGDREPTTTPPRCEPTSPDRPSARRRPRVQLVGPPARTAASHGPRAARLPARAPPPSAASRHPPESKSRCRPGLVPGRRSPRVAGVRPARVGRLLLVSSRQLQGKDPQFATGPVLVHVEVGPFGNQPGPQGSPIGAGHMPDAHTLFKSSDHGVNPFRMEEVGTPGGVVRLPPVRTDHYILVVGNPDGEQSDRPDRPGFASGYEEDHWLHPGPTNE